MRPETLGTALGVGAAAGLGTGDFLGGYASKTRDAFRVVFAAHTAGLLGIALVVAWQRLPPPPAAGIAASFAAGIVGAAATVAFYHALSRGKMGAASTLSAVLSALVPVMFSWATQSPPTSIRLMGVGVGLVAIVLLTREKGRPDRRTLAFAAAAGLGFGTFLVLMTSSGTGAGAWPVMLTRVASVPFLAIFALRRRPTGKSGIPWIGAVAGLADTAANLAFLVASGHASLDLVAVLSAMYPVFTLGLAMTVLHERPNGWQWSGFATAIAAVVLLQI